MNEDIIQPVFEIYDECSDFMDSNDIKIETLERMYTIDIATGNCHNFHHVKNVPVLGEFYSASETLLSHC